MQKQTFTQFNALSQIHTDSLQSIHNTPVTFLLTSGQFQPLVNLLPNRYLILDNTPNKVSTYTSIYFDTHSNAENPHKNTLIVNSGKALKPMDEGVSYSGLNLENSFSVDYSRASFVSENYEDKFSVDFNIKYKSGGDSHTLENLLILKVYDEHANSFVSNWLFENGIRNSEFSKYSIGKAFNRDEKLNRRYNSNLKTIKKITQCNNDKWEAYY